MLNVIIGARFNESLSTLGRAVEVQAVHFLSAHFQLVNCHLSLVGVQRTESTEFFNVDDNFHCFESRSQHMIYKLELVHLIYFHVNHLL